MLHEMEGQSLTIKQVSYLRARDPSILSYNRPPLSQVRTNLMEKFEVDKHIRVYLRMKNDQECGDLYEIKDNTLISKVPPGSNFRRNIRDGASLNRLHTFTEIFGPNTAQKDLFDYIVKLKILEFINGENSTLLTYGASGSGKTFTVIGTDEEPGIIPRSLEYLFRTLPQHSNVPPAKPSSTGDVTILSESDCRREKLLCKNLLKASLEKTQHANTYQAMQKRLRKESVALLENRSDINIGVWVSFAEIYNEQIYDLLKPELSRGIHRPRLRLGLSNGQTYIKDLTIVNVTSAQEAYQILQHGIHNLNYASTQLNSHSSRSHSIFTIRLVQVSPSDGGCFVSSFNFCDLAGSERLKKTQHVGDRLKESNNINSSLLVLGRCISGVRDAQRQKEAPIPFRESKLTQLFQKALSGNEDVAMIVNISPSREMFDESQHALNFSAIAKDISLVTQPSPSSKKNKFTRLLERKDALEEESESDVEVEELRNAVDLLTKELEIQRNEFEVNDKLNRDYIIDQYQQLLQDMEERMQKQIKDKEAFLMMKYHNDLENVRAKYERQINELQSKENVIEISSSDDEDGSGDASTKKTLKVINQTLNEGIDDYRELQNENKILLEENIRLKDEISDLEGQLESYKQQVLSMTYDKDMGSELGDEDACTAQHEFWSPLSSEAGPSHLSLFF